MIEIDPVFLQNKCVVNVISDYKLRLKKKRSYSLNFNFTLLNFLTHINRDMQIRLNFEFSQEL